MDMTMKEYVIKWVRQQKNGFRFRDVQRYIVEELHDLKYDSTMRGWGCSTLLDTGQTWYFDKRGKCIPVPRKLGVLNMYCVKRGKLYFAK